MPLRLSILLGLFLLAIPSLAPAFGCGASEASGACRMEMSGGVVGAAYEQVPLGQPDLSTGVSHADSGCPAAAAGACGFALGAVPAALVLGLTTVLLSAHSDAQHSPGPLHLSEPPPKA